MEMVPILSKPFQWTTFRVFFHVRVTLYYDFTTSFTVVFGSKDSLPKETTHYTQIISIFYRRLFDFISICTH